MPNSTIKAIKNNVGFEIIVLSDKKKVEKIYLKRGRQLIHFDWWTRWWLNSPHSPGSILLSVAQSRYIF